VFAQFRSDSSRVAYRTQRTTPHGSGMRRRAGTNGEHGRNGNMMRKSVQCSSAAGWPRGGDRLSIKRHAVGCGNEQPIGGPMKHQKEIYMRKSGPDGQRVVTASDDNTAAPVGGGKRCTDREAGEA